MPKKPDNGTMFIGVAFAEALGIFAFLVALLLMFAVV
jgi:F-type H+-transporting ATPase subunit c